MFVAQCISLCLSLAQMALEQPELAAAGALFWHQLPDLCLVQNFNEECITQLIKKQSLIGFSGNGNDLNLRQQIRESCLCLEFTMLTYTV